MSATRHFRLKEGTHYNLEKITGAAGDTEVKYTKGQVVPSTQDLVAKFGHEKFEEVAVAPAAAAAPVTAPSGSETAAGGPPKAGEGSLTHPDGKGRSELGEDVSAEWPETKEAELIVLAKDGWYYIASAAEPNKALNEKGLKKDKVAAFIKKNS